ncbi:MAG TPA: alanine--tRNA ligase [Mycobacteriales bacterium]|jgi:alanyl-tRNA synthetase|nr:alanine--tRNA ligase [Mycobacteriales bacterium]
MRSDEIRRRFLEHFTSRGHTYVPSASLISPDPTLLLVNAGMVPFKPYFLGEQPAPYERATSVQKCVRTLDIDEVGKTTRHGSFFQMAGNFSFGDYFKAGAIDLAWDLLLKPQSEGGYGLPEERLWVTVFEDDDEAERLWLAKGVPAGRIQRLGMADNYWHMGVPGPCGPDSEIFLDRGPAYGPDGGPAVGGDRFLELWNLVFMQFERGEGAGYDFPVLAPLPKQNIDTGMGMERMAAVLQGVDNLYEIDTSRAILDRAAGLTGVRYGADREADVRLRVVTDHARTAVMLIGDGVTPSNEGRGYVLRRIMRRAVRSMRLLGAQDPTMRELVDASIGAMGPQYPELVTDAGRIHSVAEHEEASFLETLRTGAQVFDLAVPQARTSGGVLSGERAFALHDTYGFPIDLTLEMAAEQGLTVDEPGFRALMQEQRERAKADNRARRTRGADTSVFRELLEAAGASTFTGYAEVRTEAVLRGLVVDGAVAQAAPEGATVQVVLDRTPFYAEAGGQLADAGRLVLADGTELEVHDVQRTLPDLVVHTARVVRGEARTGATALAEVDVDRRRSVSRAHTATHLVHKALRDALGEQATQAGSLNAPGRFRFDFASPAAVPAGVLADVEQQINEVALADLEVRAFVTTQDEARRIGAMALFGEKYGDAVRVVEVGDYARELCGGTHAARSGQLGMVKLLGEASIGSGTRRIEGLVGLDAYSHLAREHVLLAQLAEAFKVPADEVPDRVAATVAKLRDVEKELAQLKAAQVLQRAGELAGAARDVYGFAYVGVEAPAGTTGDLVRGLALDIRGRLDPGRPGAVVVAGGGAKVALVAVVNDAARARGLSARALLDEAGPAVGGRGGGKDDIAQGGGSNAAGIPEALRLAEHLVGRVATS